VRQSLGEALVEEKPPRRGSVLPYSAAQLLAYWEGLSRVHLTVTHVRTTDGRREITDTGI
jgi:hypothetical protein